MKICHVITRLIIGGAQENTVLTCRGLVQRGHDVTLLAGPETGPEGSLWAQAEATGCRLIAVPSLVRAVRPMHDLAARGALRLHFEVLRPDVVHTHSSKAGIIGRSAAAGAGVPVIVHTIHGMAFNRTQPAFVQAAYRALERRAARHTTAFVSVADAMTRQSVAAGIAPIEKFTTIRSGIETDLFAPNPKTRAQHRKTWGAADGDVVVGTVARLFANKGYDEIIAAMPAAVRAAPSLRFVWIGDGGDRGRYERMLESIGLRDRVYLAGLVPPEEVASLLTGLDALVHASRWEGLPRAVVQALLTGVPAVAFDNDGTPEVVEHERTGLLVPFGDTAGLGAALVRLAGDAALRERLGRQGREHCRRAFDWHVMVEQLERLYARLCANAAR